MLVDSGAGYSVVPGALLGKLGIHPHRERSFLLANGAEVKRQMGDATFHFHDEMASSPVIFGTPGDAALLGVVSLETLGLILDPFQRKLLPMPMMLAAQQIGSTVNRK